MKCQSHCGQNFPQAGFFLGGCVDSGTKALLFLPGLLTDLHTHALCGRSVGWQFDKSGIPHLAFPLLKLAMCWQKNRHVLLSLNSV